MTLIYSSHCWFCHDVAKVLNLPDRKQCNSIGRKINQSLLMFMTNSYCFYSYLDIRLSNINALPYTSVGKSVYWLIHLQSPSLVNMTKIFYLDLAIPYTLISFFTFIYSVLSPRL